MQAKYLAISYWDWNDIGFETGMALFLTKGNLMEKPVKKEKMKAVTESVVKVKYSSSYHQSRKPNY